MPKNRPTAAESVTPTNTALMGTDMGTGVRLRTSTATIQASITPNTPPMAASMEDSTRN